MSKTRPDIDWERVEREFRTNQLSNREIAEKFGVSETSIRYRAKKYNWKKDLSKQVHDKTKEKLLREKSNASDIEVVEEASDRGVAVIHSHRKDIVEGRNMCGILMAELYSGTKNALILEDIIQKKANDDGWNDKAVSSAMRAISLPSRAGVMRDLANSMKILQGLERTAFNLDERSTPKDSLDELLDAVMDSSRGIAGYGDNV